MASTHEPNSHELEHDEFICESGLNDIRPKNVEDEEADDDGHKPKRTGTVWSASAHIITTAIGAGVLSLPWAMAQLGWIAGISILLFFTTIALYTATFLADCYRYPHPVTGHRNSSYMDAVKAYLGGAMYKICGCIQYLVLSSFAIGYSITTAKSLVAIQKSICSRKNGGDDAPCMVSNIPHLVGFGIVEIALSQIPNFHNLSWLSNLAAIMSFGYASIGIGLSIDKIVSGPEGKTSVLVMDQPEKIWRIFTAAGDVAFACAYATLIIDIQDTLKSSPPENKVMKKASSIGVAIMTIFFTMCGTLGYAAFGDKAPENLLAGFGYHKAFWVVDLANVFIVVHLVGAYQVYLQPVFRIVELVASRRWPNSNFINEEIPISIGMVKFNANMFRVSWRTTFVVIVTVIAMALPFFSDMLALLGAISYWPLGVYFPVEMHIAQNKIGKQTIRWFGLQMLSLVSLLVSLAAASGAIHGLHKSLNVYKPFQFKE